MRAVASGSVNRPFSQVCSGVVQDAWGNGPLSLESRQRGMRSAIAGTGMDMFPLEKCLGVCCGGSGQEVLQATGRA